MNIDNDGLMQLSKAAYFSNFSWGSSGRRDPIVLPDTIAVGLVPSLPAGQAELPPGFRSWKRRLGYKMLFQSSNPQPPGNLRITDNSLRQFLDSKQYRSVLWIRDALIVPVEEGKRAKLHFKVGFAVGYTPIMDRFWPGYGSCDMNAKMARSEEIEFSAILKFKLGKMGDFGSAVLTGYRAPSAWVKVTYRVSSLGTKEIYLKGSAIPSQYLYVSGEQTAFYEMLAASKGQVENFVSTGACRDAPERNVRLFHIGL